MRETEDDFDAFVRAHRATLLVAARAVSARPADAEDLVQTALAGVYARWNQIRPPQRLAYVRRAVVNANISRWRRHRGRESSTADVPDLPHGDGTSQVDDGLELIGLLRQLPVRQRSVLVLRYLYDLPDAEIAQTLGLAPASVRSHAARGLTTLRARAAERARGAARYPSLCRAEEAL